VIVFKKVKKTQPTSINECTVIQPYFNTSAVTSTMVEMVDIFVIYEKLDWNKLFRIQWNRILRIRRIS